MAEGRGRAVLERGEAQAGERVPMKVIPAATYGLIHTVRNAGYMLRAEQP